MQRKIALLLSLLFICATGLAGVSHYKLDVKLDHQNRLIEGTATVNYLNRSTKPLTEVYFRLSANLGRESNPKLAKLWNDQGYLKGFDPSWTEVNKVTDGQGNPLLYTYEDALPVLQNYSLAKGFVKVALPEPLLPGERTVLVLAFRTKVPLRLGDEGYANGFYTWRFGWYPLERELVDDAWDQGSRDPVATYELNFDVPLGFTVLAGGLEGQMYTRGLRNVYSGKSPGRQRSLPIVITTEHTSTTLQGEGVAIHSYFLPGHNRVGRLLPMLAARVIRDYQEHYGPYPYKEVYIIEHTGTGVGMAADGFVLLPTDVYKYQDLVIPGLFDRLVEGVLAHEIAHHYWGIGIGMDLDAENWLSEGFAQYLSISYYERYYGATGNNLFAGKDPLLSELMRYYFGKQNYRERNEWGYLSTYQVKMDEAVIKPWREVKYINASSSRIYEKGYLILRALEDLVGLEQMEAILQTAYRKHGQNPAMSVEELAQVAEEVTGKSLEAYFQSWLYSDDGWVDYQVSSFQSEPQEDSWQTEVRVERKGTNAQPVTVQVRCEDGTVHRQRWSADTAQATLIFNTPTKVVQVEMDPDKMLLDVNRLNNTKPRKVEWTIHNDTSLDSYVIRYYPGIVPGNVFGGSIDSFELGFGLSGRVRNNFMVDLFQVFPQDSYGYRIPVRGLQFGYSVGRSFSTSGYVVEALGLRSTMLGASYSFWRPMNIGQSGTYWHPVHNFTAVVGKDKDKYSGDEEGLWQLNYTRDDSPRFAMSNSFTLMGFSDGSRAGAWDWLKISRPGLNTLLITTANYSASKGLAPNYGFALGLNSFPTEVGHFRAGGTAELVFQLVQQQEGQFMYGTLFEDIEAKVYLEAAGVWNDPASRAKSYRVGGGVEVTFGFTTSDLSGGAYPFGITIGICSPLWSASGQMPKGANLYFTAGLRYFRTFLGI